MEADVDSWDKGSVGMGMEVGVGKEVGVGIGLG